MHPVNKALAMVGMKISKIPSNDAVPRDFIREYEEKMKELGNVVKGFDVIKAFRYDAGAHPEDFVVYQCIFAAYHINRIRPATILDIGSYREFIVGMLSNYNVTTIDVRQRTPVLQNETVVTCDAKKMSLPDNKFDAIVTLCALEHFGLGRYGDEFDLDADKKAFKEMIRVLKPGGSLIFTTMMTAGRPHLDFNAHRVYSHEMLKELCKGLVCTEEKFYSNKKTGFCDYEYVTNEPGAWDVYCGCWTKK
jgi:SAM-dependent methyltransferase